MQNMRSYASHPRVARREGDERDTNILNILRRTVCKICAPRPFPRVTFRSKAATQSLVFGLASRLPP